MSLEEQIEELEKSPNLGEYDRRQVKEWRQRLDDGDTFDRQDRSDIKQMHDSL
jgi:hypothetical protein